MDPKDMALMVAIIDTVVKRGAIEGNEMEAVGALRGRVVALLKELEKEANE